MDGELACDGCHSAFAHTHPAVMVFDTSPPLLSTKGAGLGGRTVAVVVVAVDGKRTENSFTLSAVGRATK